MRKLVRGGTKVSFGDERNTMEADRCSPHKHRTGGEDPERSSVSEVSNEGSEELEETWEGRRTN